MLITSAHFSGRVPVDVVVMLPAFDNHLFNLFSSVGRLSANVNNSRPLTGVLPVSICFFTFFRYSFLPFFDYSQILDNIAII